MKAVKITEKNTLKDTGLKLERQAFKSCNGDRQYWAYSVCGKIKNSEIKVNFIPCDKGGYKTLELVFEGADEVRLNSFIKGFTNKDMGEVDFVSFYEAESSDRDGNIYKSAVKPRELSDKNLLAMLINNKGV